MFIDTHCHLNMDFFEEDWKDVAFSAYNEGVKFIITIGTNLNDSKKGVEISKKIDFIYTSVGWHPHDTKYINGFNDIMEVMKLAKNNKKVIAIGEIGLDFYKNYSPKDVQEKFFRMQINVAKELNLPIIIHDRDAQDRVYEILREEKADEVGGVFHCFSGDYEFAKKIFDINFMISFTGTITFRKNRNRAYELIKKVPIDLILTETDAPFLTPEPYRGKRNEPKYVKYVTEKIAEFKNMDLEEVCEKILTNAKNLFNLPHK